MARGPVDIREASTGAAFELRWSDDHTVVRLAIYTKDGQQKAVKLTTQELDELRQFLNDRID